MLSLVFILIQAVVAQRWRVENPAMAAIALGIAQGGMDNVYMGGFVNGPGRSLVFTSNNNGRSYTNQELGEGPFLYTAAAAHYVVGNQAVVAGHNFGFSNGIQQTEDSGASWRGSRDPQEFPISTTQSCGAVRNREGLRMGQFGCVGTFPGGQEAIGRVVFSADGGVSWRQSSTIAFNVRYAAYPTSTTWYVTGGTYPNMLSEKQRVQLEADGVEDVSIGFGLSIRVQKSAQGKEMSASFHNYWQNQNISAADFDEKAFSAFVFKTIDGGATWQRVFFSNGAGYYGQGIDCVDSEVCMFAAEGSVGGIVFSTVDGGRTWNPVLTVPSPQYGSVSLYPVTCVVGSQRICYAAGARQEFLTPTMGIVYNTQDGGVTWQLTDEVPGASFTSMSLSDRNPAGRYAGHATIIFNGQSGTAVLDL